MLVDSLLSLWRCNCGRLYKDSGWHSGQCNSCRNKVIKEWENQCEADKLLAELSPTPVEGESRE